MDFQKSTTTSTPQPSNQLNFVTLSVVGTAWYVAVLNSKYEPADLATESQSLPKPCYPSKKLKSYDIPRHLYSVSLQSSRETWPLVVVLYRPTPSVERTVYRTLR